MSLDGIGGGAGCPAWGFCCEERAGTAATTSITVTWVTDVTGVARWRVIPVFRPQHQRFFFRRH